MTETQRLTYALVLILVVLVGGGLMTALWPRRALPGGRSFLGIVGAGLWWTMADAAGLLLPHPQWVTLAYVGIGALPVAWLAFCLEYTGRGHWLTRRVVAAALLPALLTLPVVATGLRGQWMWIQGEVSGQAVVTMGWWNLGFVAYSYFLCAVGYVLLLVNLAEASRLHRQQAALLLLSGSVPWAVNFLQIIDVYPRVAPNPTPLAFIVSACLYFWGIFRLQLLEITPVAQRLVIHQMADGLVVLNTAGRVALLNPAAEAILGVTNAAAVGSSLADCLPQWAALVAPTAGGAAGHFELTSPRPGDARCYDVRHAVICDDRNRPIGHYLLLRDITRRKQAADELERLLASGVEANAMLRAEIRERERVERELHLSEQSSRTLFDNAVMGLYRTTPAGQILLCNPALVRLLGFDSFEELARQNLEEQGFAPGYERAQFKAALERDGAVMGLESQWRRRDGSLVWVRENARAIRDAAGQVGFYDGTVEDLTVLKEAEERRRRFDEQMQQMQKLEGLGVLAGGIAHDFNNLLSVIMGHAGLAELDAPAGSPTHAALRQINEAAIRAAELCRQMLAYSGQGRFEVGTIKLPELIQETLPLMKTAVARNARLALDLPDSLPAMRGDAGQLRQVLLNLVTNAAEAVAERGGDIRVAAGSRWFATEELAGYLSDLPLPSGAYLWLSVADDGGGMTEEVRRRMFEPFFTTKFAGRGLGLSAVLGIARSHGGGIMVETQLERGTEVRVLFPIASELSAPTDPLRPDAAWTGRGRILVADDEVLAHATLGPTLSRLGFDVVLVPNGRAAVERYRQDGASFRLVLLDLTRSGMDSREALRELRALNPEVKVILLSGFTETEFFRKGGVPAPAPCLTKPFTHEALVRRLRAVLG